MRIAINGFGRIGRNIARHLLSNDDFKNIELVAVNDLGSIDANAHLLKYDSVHGILDKDIQVNSEKALISIDDKDVLYLSERDPSNLPWSELDIDFVFESTGFFTKVDDANKHIDAGAKKVIISAPSPDVEKTIVFGVNHQILNSDDVIISNASCTTNCLAPIVKVIHENFGIKSGLINTVHASTNDQSLLDVAHSDLYRARAASASMIPSKTGAAKAIGLVIPELDGKLNGLATRVPTLNVSMLDLTFESDANFSIDELHAALISSADSELKDVLKINSLPLVSSDFNHNDASSIFDTNHTQQIGNLTKILAWYDNEWGFSKRMLDLGLYFYEATIKSSIKKSA